MRNTAIEKVLNRKMRPRYLWPNDRRLTQQGRRRISYATSDGKMLAHAPITAFRVVPYLAQSSIDIPGPWKSTSTCSGRPTARTRVHSTTADPDNPGTATRIEEIIKSDNDYDGGRRVARR